MAGHHAEADRLARMLARNAGVDWDRLPDYPGYSRYYWREQAEALAALIGGGAEAALAQRRAVP